MKYILFISLLSSCSIADTNAPSGLYSGKQDSTLQRTYEDGFVSGFDIYRSGMHYYILERSSGGVCAINITLDSLNVNKFK